MSLGIQMLKIQLAIHCQSISSRFPVNYYFKQVFTLKFGIKLYFLLLFRIIMEALTHIEHGRLHYFLKSDNQYNA